MKSYPIHFSTDFKHKSLNPLTSILCVNNIIFVMHQVKGLLVNLTPLVLSEMISHPFKIGNCNWISSNWIHIESNRNWIGEKREWLQFSEPGFLNFNVDLWMFKTVEDYILGSGSTFFAISWHSMDQTNQLTENNRQINGHWIVNCSATTQCLTLRVKWLDERLQKNVRKIVC